MTVEESAPDEVVALMSRVEDLEVPLVAWGVAQVGTPRHRVVELAAEQVGADAADDLVEQAVELALLYDDDIAERRCDDSSCRCVLVRSRAAETMRLLAGLRQLRRSTSSWRDGPRLVRDFRFERRPRRFPDRTAVSRDTLLSMADLLPAEGRQALRQLLTDHDGASMPVSRFQARALEEILTAAGTHGGRAVMISAGTGTGKTKAFYLPALSLVAAEARSDEHRPLLLAIYPRIELLKDQLTEAFREVRKLDELVERRIGRRLRVGALYGDVPRTRNSPLRDSWRRAGQGHVCPFLRCPRCDGALVTTDRTHLECSCGYRAGPAEISLDRRSMANAPPDIVFVTGDMLNRVLGHLEHRKIVGADGVGAPRTVLLDEVHTYEATSGAQTAMLLRRWTHAARAADSTFVGLSATLRDATRFLSQLTAVPEDRVADVRVHADELRAWSHEYLVALRNDAAAGTATLSTTIQTLMLLGRCLDDRDPSTGGVFGRKVFAFTDNLDVTNRLYSNLCDAEGRLIWGKPMTDKQSLALLRSPDAYGGLADEHARHHDAQLWDLPLRLGHDLRPGHWIPLGRTNSKDAGLDPDAKVVVATASLEVGLDDPFVGAVVQHGAPRDMAQFLQRKGRAGRSPRMQPWTVVVLSQYGRDQVSYAAWDQLLNPALPARRLPVRNRYVLRMHATIALLDWIAEQRPSGLADDADLWLLLGGPPAAGRWRSRHRDGQLAVAHLLGQLLDDRGLQDELVEHVAAALSISPEDAQDLMVTSPRSIILEAVPQLLQQLRTEWRGFDVDRGEGTSPPPPLPGYIPPNLFSPLELPAVEVNAERRDGAHTFEEELPADRALREFAPGNVSRRAATDEQTRSHWVPLPDSAPAGNVVQDVEVRGRYPGTVQVSRLTVPCGDLVCRESCGNEHTVSVLRPRAVRVDVTPPQVSPTSRTFPRWRSRIDPGARAVDLRLPGPGHGLTAMRFHLHAQRAPATVTRACLGAMGTGQVNGVEHHYAAGFTADGRAVTLGNQTTVDACELSIHVPEAWAELEELTADVRRGVEAAWLRERVLRAAGPWANQFRAGWLHDALVVAAASAVEPDDRSVGDVARRLRDDLASALGRAVDLLLRRVDDAELAGTPAKVHESLHQLLEVPELVDALRRAAQDEQPDTRRAWLHARMTRTLGLATLRAARELCVDHDPEGVLLDVVGDAVWLTEPTPGGLGFLEELVRRVESAPQTFVRMVHRALLPGDTDVIDRALRTVLAAADDPADDVTAEVARFRATTEPEVQEQALTGLRAALERRSVAATHAAVSAVTGRLLRSGTSTASDLAIRAIIEGLDAIETQLGLQVERRLAAPILLEEIASRELVSSVGLDGDAATILDVLDLVLWPRGWQTLADAVDDWNPYEHEPPRPAPAVLHERISAQQPIMQAEGATMPDVLRTLGEEGVVQLVAPADRPAPLASLVSQLMAETIDMTVLRSTPRLLDVERGHGALTATIVLPEHVERIVPWEGRELGGVRVIRTYGDGRSQAVADVVAGVLGMELLHPSESVWLVSPWISDIPVLDNSDGDLSGIAGDLPKRQLAMSEVARRLAKDPRCNLTVVMRDEPSNRAVRRALEVSTGPKARLVLDPNVHEKTLLTDRIMITGSMNFTFSGMDHNLENVTVDRDLGRIQQAHVQLADRHGSRHGR